jgi:hypothetical protein
MEASGPAEGAVGDTLRPKLQEVRNHADTTNRPRQIRFIPAPFVEYYYHN